jgi:hypothetical protein
MGEIEARKEKESGCEAKPSNINHAQSCSLRERFEYREFADARLCRTKRRVAKVEKMFGGETELLQTWNYCRDSGIRLPLDGKT